MDPSIYEKIYSQLSSSNLKSLSGEFGVDEDMLTCIFNQKMVRSNKTRYHKVANDAEKFLSRWEKGESFMKLSDEAGLSPVLVTIILLKRKGMSRKGVRKLLDNPEDIEDERLKEELFEVTRNDYLFSKRAHSLQIKRAKRCEDTINKWLKEKNVEFLTEEQIKECGDFKTPDFLLKKPLKINGLDIIWIESKGLFGDIEEHRRLLEKQFLGYIDNFGPGMAVYWYGFLDSIEKEHPEVMIKDSTYFGVDNARYI
jgi:hypothetical protein